MTNLLAGLAILAIAAIGYAIVRVTRRILDRLQPP